MVLSTADIILLIREAKHLVVFLLPPEEYGEDYDVDRLYEILDELEVFIG